MVVDLHDKLYLPTCQCGVCMFWAIMRFSFGKTDESVPQTCTAMCISQSGDCCISEIS